MEKKSEIGGKNVERLKYWTTIVALIYILIALIGGVWMAYLKSADEFIEDYIVSAHAHFLGMSIILFIWGVNFSGWVYMIEEGKTKLTKGSLRGAQLAVDFLALGALLTFIFQSMDIREGTWVGYVLYFIGFLIMTIGYIRTAKPTS